MKKAINRNRRPSTPSPWHPQAWFGCTSLHVLPVSTPSLYLLTK